MTKYLDSDGLAHLWEKLKSFFVAQSKIANNATTTESGFVLDARTGKVLADQITDLNAQINSLKTSLTNKAAASDLTTLAALIPSNGAWAHGRLDGTTVNLKFSHNVESITTSDGHTFYVKFIKPFPDEYYAAVGSFEIGGIGQEIVGVYSYGTAGFSIDVQNASGNAATPSTISVIALR